MKDWPKEVRDVLAALSAVYYRAGGKDRARWEVEVDFIGRVVVVLWRVKWWCINVLTPSGHIDSYRFPTTAKLIAHLRLWLPEDAWKD